MFIHIYNELQQISKHTYHIHFAGSVTGDAGVDAGGVDAGVDAATVVPASLRFTFKFWGM